MTLFENAIPRADQRQYAKTWFLDHVFGPQFVDERWPTQRAELRARVLERVREAQPQGRTLQIPRVKGVTVEEFHRVYLPLGQPVILEGAAKEWPCVQKWTPQFLADKYGEDRVTLIDASPSDLNNVDYTPETTTLRDVILSMDEAPLKKYSRFNRILHEHPELLEDFDLKTLLRMRNRVASGKTFQVFIGGKGSKTHLHCAAEHNLFTQVYGRKHWVLYPPSYDCVLEPPVNRTPYFHSHFDPDAPDLEKFPAMAHLDRYECVLEPGDILYNPPSYWHHVSNLTGSIGVGFRWFAPFDCFRIDFMQALLTLLAVDPPIWVATQHRTDFAKVFTHKSRKRAKEAALSR